MAEKAFWQTSIKSLFKDPTQEQRLQLARRWRWHHVVCLVPGHHVSVMWTWDMILRYWTWDMKINNFICDSVMTLESDSYVILSFWYRCLLKMDMWFIWDSVMTLRKSAVILFTRFQISWAPGSSSCIQIVDVSTAAAAGSVTSAWMCSFFLLAIRAEM